MEWVADFSGLRNGYDISLMKGHKKLRYESVF
jgi:hypothetical protein